MKEKLRNPGAASSQTKRGSKVSELLSKYSSPTINKSWTAGEGQGDSQGEDRGQYDGAAQESPPRRSSSGGVGRSQAEQWDQYERERAQQQMHEQWQREQEAQQQQQFAAQLQPAPVPTEMMIIMVVSDDERLREFGPEIEYNGRDAFEFCARGTLVAPLDATVPAHEQEEATFVFEHWSSFATADEQAHALENTTGLLERLHEARHARYMALELAQQDAQTPRQGQGMSEAEAEAKMEAEAATMEAAEAAALALAVAAKAEAEQPPPRSADRMRSNSASGSFGSDGAGFENMSPMVLSPKATAVTTPSRVTHLRMPETGSFAMASAPQVNAVWAQWQSSTHPSTFDGGGGGEGDDDGGRDEDWVRLREAVGSEDHRSANRLIKQVR
jgi:hypothetical protein